MSPAARIHIRATILRPAALRKEIRLEMADRIPEVGEYVIIHAGFAIRTLSEEEAEYNLSLLRQMATDVPLDADAQTAKLDTAFGVLLVLSLVAGVWL